MGGSEPSWSLKQGVDEYRKAVSKCFKLSVIMTTKDENPVTKDARPRRFVGRKNGASTGTNQGASQKGGAVVPSTRGSGRRRALAMNQVPDSIKNDPELARAMEQLPSNYNFQVAKTLWRLKSANARRVALQLPEGLLIYACILADIFEQIGGVEHVMVMADVTYGACCIDDYSARALDCDFLIHYGHSCLVPIDITGVNDSLGQSLQVMYVFVDIDIDVGHLVESVKLTFPDRNNTRLALMGTIQFASSMHKVKLSLDEYYWKDCIVPQSKPLSKGEVLGCTSPSIEEYAKKSLADAAASDDGTVTAFVFIADGRFHLESAMIANPNIPAYRYNPYDKVLSHEKYDTDLMTQTRQNQIQRAKSARKWGVVLGTLGRQGNTAILRRIEDVLRSQQLSYNVMLLSEMFPAKLSLLDAEVDAWIQIACPRLSIDWGTAFSKPLLTPYEAFVALEQASWRSVYPQDFYSSTGGPWTNFYKQ